MPLDGGQISISGGRVIPAKELLKVALLCVLDVASAEERKVNTCIGKTHYKPGEQAELGLQALVDTGNAAVSKPAVSN